LLLKGEEHVIDNVRVFLLEILERQKEHEEILQHLQLDVEALTSVLPGAERMNRFDPAHKEAFDSSAAPQDETCVNSLFPQLGYRACWYVSKSKMKL
jgi:hypothetical protein